MSRQIEPRRASSKTPPVIAICASTPSDVPIAERLADRLSLPLRNGHPDPAAYVLLVEGGRTMLRPPTEVAARPIVVDFADPRLRHRRLLGGGSHQPIARAVGLRFGRRLSVIDATAGLGRDAFILASLGAEVLLLERSAVIGALLSDGLERGRADSEIAPILARMRMIETDASKFLQGLNEAQRPDVIYLDPMYPPRTKSAKVRKEMIALQAVIGPDTDAEKLLALSLTLACDRVVVKRPASAPPLSDQLPDASTGAGNTRFDIYLTHLAHTKDD